MRTFAILIATLIPTSFAIADNSTQLRLGTFTVDISPPIGSPLAYDPTVEVTELLTCRGVILKHSDQPAIILCSLDWLGVANAAQDEFKLALAEAASTSIDRCMVHTIHQHDAPRCDLSAAAILESIGMAGPHYDQVYIRDCIARTRAAVEKSMKSLQPVQTLGVGKSKVEQVASNRRMLTPEGKVHTTRYTACRDPLIRELPVGVIDPWLKCLVFVGQTGPLAAISCYATHPQSYYRTGQANPDFPGMARNAREQDTGVFHLHFNGAGGNIGAGKYNDGAHENRAVLASRVEASLRSAWDAALSTSHAVDSMHWKTSDVVLPAGSHLQAKQLEKTLEDETITPAIRVNTAKKLAYLQRQLTGEKITVGRLSLNNNHFLFMPGELFVEYQLAAQAIKPEAEVLMAAYGEYGTGYIGTRVAYSQGGYEVSERASNVAPESELVLLLAMRELLGEPDSRVLASDFTDTSGPLPKKSQLDK